MNLAKKRWVTLIACCFINLCLGSIYVWSVFASSMAEFLSAHNSVSLTTADLAIVYTVANSVGPITMITGGWFNDKFGPKKVILAGGLMVGVGMIASGFATSVGMLVVTYGLIFGLGLGMTYGTAVSSCMKFFPDKRGLIGGITTAIYGLGSVILPPVVTLIVSKSSATTAFKIVGIAFLIIICGCSFLMEQCPADFKPEGWNPPTAMKQGGAENKNWKEMLKTPVFYVMLLLFTCGAFSGMMVISQASAVAANMVGMTAVMASTAVSVLAVFNASGRILAGLLSDRIGRHQHTDHRDRSRSCRSSASLFYRRRRLCYLLYRNRRHRPQLWFLHGRLSWLHRRSVRRKKQQRKLWYHVHRSGSGRLLRTVGHAEYLPGGRSLWTVLPRCSRFRSCRLCTYLCISFFHQ